MHTLIMPTPIRTLQVGSHVIQPLVETFAGNLRAGSQRLTSAALPCAQVNPRYLGQLQAVLTWPQSAGIVGGRPSSSLYFVGTQGAHVLYLDPHDVQDVRAL